MYTQTTLVFVTFDVKFAYSISLAIYYVIVRRVACLCQFDRTCIRIHVEFLSLFISVAPVLPRGLYCYCKELMKVNTYFILYSVHWFTLV